MVDKKKEITDEEKAAIERITENVNKLAKATLGLANSLKKTILVTVENEETFLKLDKSLKELKEMVGDE